MTLLNKRKYSNSKKKSLSRGSKKVKRTRSQKGSGNITEMAKQIDETKALNQAGETATNAAKKILNDSNEENTIQNNRNMNNSGSSTLVDEKEKSNNKSSQNTIYLENFKKIIYEK